MIMLEKEPQNHLLIMKPPTGPSDLVPAGQCYVILGVPLLDAVSHQASLELPRQPFVVSGQLALLQALSPEGP